MLRRLTMLVFVVMTVPCFAGFGVHIPGPHDIEVKVKIPGLNKILQAKPALAGSLEDATTTVTFLDDFDPQTLIPMVEAPRIRNGGFALASGAWQAEMESYCLNAGAHGPGSNEGYLWTPLKGPIAGEISDILRNTVLHPDIPQHDIQVMIWGLLARTKISDMSPKLQREARALLTPKQIRHLNGGALARIPEKLFDRAFGELPPAARDVMEAEARIRNMVSGEIADFDAIEHVALVPGDPDLDPSAPLRGRWSYRAGGFFARYLPTSYGCTNTTVVVPDVVHVEQDTLGRITVLEDRAGNRVEAGYNDAIAPATIAGDAAVIGYAFESIRLLAPGAPPHELTLTNVGWTLVGTPSGDGQAQAGVAPFTDLAERYAWAVTQNEELTQLASNARQATETSAPEIDTTASLTFMMNLANFHHALGLATASNAGEPWLQVPLELPRQAWMSTLWDIADGRDLTATEQVRIEMPQPIRLASAMLSPRLFSGMGMAVHGRHGTLADRRPPGGWTNSGAARSSRDRQPLGQSGRPTRDGNGKDILQKAKDGIGLIGYGTDAIGVVMDPVGTVAGKFGFGVHDQIKSGYFDWLFGTTAKISKALGGDPPRPDFNIIEPAPQVTLGSPDDFGPIPAARADALNNLRFALDNLVAMSRVAKISLDRLGGAMEAGDDAWETDQARAFMEYKRRTGVWFTETARCLDAVLDELASEGITDVEITPAAYSAYQARLRASGFNADELEAARQAGVNDADIAAALQERLALDPNAISGNLLEKYREAAQVMRELGARWETLPANDLEL